MILGISVRNFSLLSDQFQKQEFITGEHELAKDSTRINSNNLVKIVSVPIYQGDLKLILVLHVSNGWHHVYCLEINCSF